MNPSPSKSHRADLHLLAVYFAVVALYLLASLFPQARLWGVNWWGFLPSGINYVLFIVALAAGTGAFLLSSRFPSDEAKEYSNKAYIVLASAASATLLVGFLLLENATHFLGDGYQLLARLASGAAPLKSWEIGALKLEYAVYSILGGTPESRALGSFQIISVASGILLLASVGIATRFLFERVGDRMLFFSGAVTGGYMLLYFGYVENYPLFVTAVMIYTLSGLLIIAGKVNRRWALIPLVGALILHVFAVTLVPSFVYLLVRETRFGRRFADVQTPTKLVLALAALVVAGAVYVYVYSHNFFFRFAVLPLISDRFTLRGDTLFSPKRLIDLFNFVLMLVPGILVLALAMYKGGLRKKTKLSDMMFLGVLTLSVWGAVFLFNPRLGLPRDWDLFSFAGAPLAVLLYYGVLKSQATLRLKTIAVSLAVLLGVLSLASRVAVFADRDSGVAAFKSYSLLDETKNRNTYMTMIDVLERGGDTSGARIERAEYDRRYPEADICQRAGKLVNESQFAEAIPYCQEAILSDPTFADAYANLGLCYADQGRMDSAVILCRIADGLNPHSAIYMNNLGTAYLRAADYVNAKECFVKALEIDSTITNSVINLSLAYFMLGEFEKSYQYLEKLSPNPLVPADYYLGAGDGFCSKRQFDFGRRAYALALRHGLDSATVREHMARYPEPAK